MHYEGAIYRPPSEAYSLIIQVTVGCTHNKCTFCSMYKADKFKVKPLEIVLADLQEARQRYRNVDRIFFADGDALCLSTDKLTYLLETTTATFPECTRIGANGRPGQILSKSEEELIALRERGLGILYIGAESGSDEVLRRVNKGETADEIIKAVQKVEKAGIAASVTFISGLGGKELTTEHAVQTGKMISAMGASYVGLLTLILEPSAPLYADARAGIFEQLTPLETLEELETILQHSNCTSETVFRSNHASNWLVLKGTLPQDKEAMLEQVRFAKTDSRVLRAAKQRGL